MEIINFSGLSNAQIQEEITRLSDTMVAQIPCYAKAQDSELAIRQFKCLETELKRLSLFLAERMRRIDSVKERTEQLQKEMESRSAAPLPGDTVIWTSQGKEYVCTVLSVDRDILTLSYNGFTGSVPMSEVKKQ